MADAITEDSAFFMEYVDFTDCATNTIKADSNTKELFLSGENIYFEYTTANPTSAVVIGALTECSLQGVEGLGADTTNSAFLITGGGYLNISSARIEDWGRGFYVDATGAEPYLKIQAVDIDDCTYNIYVDNPNAVGYFVGFSDIAKTYIDAGSDFFIVDNDSNILTVAGRGGEFSSVKAAVDYAAAYANDNNKFLVKIGPGVFTEDAITLVGNVYIDGSQRFATEIRGKAGQFTVHAKASGPYASPKTSISNCIISANAATQSSETLVRYEGGLVRFIATRFYTCDTAINATDVSGVPSGGYPNSLQFNDCSVGPGKTITNFIKVSSDGTHSATAVMNNVNIADGTVLNFLRAERILTTARVTNSRIIQSSSSGRQTAVRITDAARLQLLSCIIQNFDTGLSVPWEGDPPDVQLLGAMFESNTTDISILHPTATGNINGVADREKTFIDADLVSIIIGDPDDGSMTVVGDFYQGSSFNTSTDLTTMLSRGQSLGVMYGGDIGVDSAGDVIVDAGYGYLQVGDAPDDHLTFVMWDSVVLQIGIDIPFNSNTYISVQHVTGDIGEVVVGASSPDFFVKIFLGRVIVDADSVVAVQPVPRTSVSTATQLDKIFRYYLGPIYRSGSDVTALAGQQRVQVTAGSFAFSTHEFLPSAANPITFVTWHRKPSTSYYTITEGVTDIPNDKWDKEAQDNLENVTGNWHTSHGIYVSGSGADTVYHLVYSQGEWELQADAEAAIPIPPSPLSLSIPLIATVIMKQGTSSVVNVITQKPTLVTRTGTVASAALHSSLLNLTAPYDDHTQYLLTSGSRAMGGNLAMGNNSITGVNLVDGVDVSAHVSRHIPGSGTDELTVAAPDTNLSTTTTNYAGVQPKFSRSDHRHAITTTSVAAVSTIVATDSAGSFQGYDIAANHNLTVTNVATFNGTFAGTAILPLANGGTNANLSVVQGGVVYSGASALAISAAGTSAGQVLQSNTTSAPSWSTATYPSTIAAGEVLYGNGTNVGKLAWDGTATRYLANTGSSAPAWAQIALTTGVYGVLPVANGGTNASSFTASRVLVSDGAGTTLTVSTVTAAQLANLYVSTSTSGHFVSFGSTAGQLVDSGFTSSSFTTGHYHAAMYNQNTATATTTATGGTLYLVTSGFTERGTASGFTFSSSYKFTVANIQERTC